MGDAASVAAARLWFDRTDFAKSQVAEAVDQECVGSALGGFGEDLGDQGAREVADLLLDLWCQALGGVFQLGGGDRVEQHLREDFERGPSVAMHVVNVAENPATALTLHR